MSFLQLPAEIRLEIYRFTFAYIHCVQVWRGSTRRLRIHVMPRRELHGNPTNILLLCRQISNEALDVLYDQARFTMDDSLEDLRDYWTGITLKNQQRVQNVLFVGDSMLPHASRHLLGRVFPVQMMANLRRLTVILPHIHCPGCNEDVAEKNLERLCKFVNEHGSGKLVVELDYESEVDLAEFFDELFTKVGWRKVKTTEGDLMFGRKRESRGLLGD